MKNFILGIVGFIGLILFISFATVTLLVLMIKAVISQPKTQVMINCQYPGRPLNADGSCNNNDPANPEEDIKKWKLNVTQPRSLK